MGQCQFMPSSFLNFAVDNDGDGRRDIWTTKADVFASAANYLSQSGWRGDQTWGRQVSLPKNFDTALANLDTVKVLNDWQLLGVRRVNGADLPTRPLMASLVLPERKAEPASSDPGDNDKSGASPAAYLVYENYRATLKWNRSTFFAMAVGHLADAIGRR
jgi:membrane-bound lytic murein transglycosylase B